jgi:hypothetical protein
LGRLLSSRLAGSSILYSDTMQYSGEPQKRSASTEDEWEAHTKGMRQYFGIGHKALKYIKRFGNKRERKLDTQYWIKQLEDTK